MRVEVVFIVSQYYASADAHDVVRMVESPRM